MVCSALTFPGSAAVQFQPWQALLILIIRAVIAAFLIDLNEAIEGQNRAGRSQLGRAASTSISTPTWSKTAADI